MGSIRGPAAVLLFSLPIVMDWNQFLFFLFKKKKGRKKSAVRWTVQTSPGGQASDGGLARQVRWLGSDWMAHDVLLNTTEQP